jgi:hypothetical protein
MLDQYKDKQIIRKILMVCLDDNNKDCFDEDELIILKDMQDEFGLYYKG